MWVTFRRSSFLIVMVNLLGCQEGGVIRGSGLALLLGYLGDGIGLQREVREVSGREMRVCQEQDSFRPRFPVEE